MIYAISLNTHNQSKIIGYVNTESAAKDYCEWANKQLFDSMKARDSFGDIGVGLPELPGNSIILYEKVTEINWK